MHGFSWIVGMNGEFYRAIGKPSYETIVTLSTLIIYLAAYFYAISFGLDVFVWVRFVLALGALFIHLILVKVVLKILLYKLIEKIAIITATSFLISTLILKILILLMTSEILILIFGVSFSMMIIFALIYIIEKNKLIPKIKPFIAQR